MQNKLASTHPLLVLVYPTTPGALAKYKCICTQTHTHTTIQPRVQLAECDETIETEETEIFITNTHRKKNQMQKRSNEQKIIV